MSRSHIRQELSELESTLRRELDTLIGSQTLNVNVATGSLSELVDEFAKLKLVDHPIYIKMMKLDAALCQLDLGLYGLCADCEAEIETKILLADPTEQRCANCAEHFKHEHGLELRLDH